ncbi:MAG: LD-carboxypeptidase [Chloroflexota bacterium]|nr:LD-carboxypeptidase [Chloroflexota bacterium]
MGVQAKPRRLAAGMTLGVIAPSSPVRTPGKVERGLARLEQLGFEVVLGAHVHETYGYLAGADAARADDLLTMLERDDVDAVVCLGGGYGAARTIQALDLDRLRRLRRGPVKPFVGYSDITVLHALLQHELHWTTFYGPMISSFADATAYTLEAFRQALMTAEPFPIHSAPDAPPLQTLVAGRAQGVLVGGCLSLMVSLVGTPWAWDLRKKIVFFEDVGEQPYRIDRMLTQLIMAGGLTECAGIVIGEHVDCEPREPHKSLRLEQVFADLLRPLGVPMLYGLPIGHGHHLATLPVGARVELDASGQQLRFLEPGVL